MLASELLKQLYSDYSSGDRRFFPIVVDLCGDRIKLTSANVICEDHEDYYEFQIVRATKQDRENQREWVVAGLYDLLTCIKHNGDKQIVITDNRARCNFQYKVDKVWMFNHYDALICSQYHKSNVRRFVETDEQCVAFSHNNDSNVVRIICDNVNGHVQYIGLIDDQMHVIADTLTGVINKIIETVETDHYDFSWVWVPDNCDIPYSDGSLVVLL